MGKKHVLLIIGGGVAAYKSLFLIRELARRGIGSEVVISKAGQEFVTPLSASSLSGKPVFTDLFSLFDEAEMGHIELSRSADLVVVAPATADMIAKLAGGLANDLASTTLLATDKLVLMAPAMNVRMWEHASTQRNIKTLKDQGVLFVGPDKGDMACGEYGFGRMAEPATIADAIEAALQGDTRIDAFDGQPLSGKHILVTAGPTREPIDPVRYLSNRSSGKQGYAIAQACAKLGARVSLVSGPVALKAPLGVELVKVETAEDMLSACARALPADVFISVAAVADWRPASSHGKKMKKDADAPSTLQLVENPDILKTLSTIENRPELVVGFAAETHDVLKYAKAKLQKKRCDWIVANDVSGDVMGGENNTMHIVTKDGVKSWPELSKSAAALRLARNIAKAL